MKFTIPRRALLDAARQCSAAASSKGAHPVYESMLVEASAAGAMRFTATDLEIGVSITGEATVEAAGAAAIPVRDLAALLAKLAEGEVSIETVDGRATVRSGRSSHRLGCHSKEDFPETPKPNTGVAWRRVNAAEFANCVGRVVASVAKQRERFALNGALLVIENESLVLVATDGKRLSLATCQTPAGAEVRAIVSRKGLEQSVALCEGEESIEVCSDPHHFYARNARASVVSRLVDGSFPKYQDVIPSSTKTRATMNRAELLAALGRVGMVGADQIDRGIARFEFCGDALKMTARQQNREAEESLACELDGPELSIGLDTDLLTPLVACLDGERVTFEMNGGTYPVKFVEAAQTHVQMPITID